MKRFSLAMLTLFVCAGAQAASTEVKMNLVTAEGTGQSVGSVNISETDKGLKFTPDLKGSRPVNMAFMFMPKGHANLR